MPLTLSNQTVVYNWEFRAIVQGAAQGSTLALTTNPGGRWSFGGSVLSCSEPLPDDVPVITETLAGGGSTIYPFVLNFRNVPTNMKISGVPPIAIVGGAPVFAPVITGGIGPFYMQVLGKLPAGRSLSGLTVVGTYLSFGPNVYELLVGDSTGATVRLTVSENVAGAIGNLFSAINGQLLYSAINGQPLISAIGT